MAIFLLWAEVGRLFLGPLWWTPSTTAHAPYQTCLILKLEHDSCQPDFDESTRIYLVYRKDRATSTGLKLCGVGVIIVLRKESLDILYSDIRCKALFVTVKADSGTRMVICGVCIPPNSTSEAYSYFAQILEEVIASNSPLSCILFVGDNLLELNWVSPDSSLASVSEIDLIDVAALLDVDQISSVRNDSGVQLDLVFCFGFCCPTALDQLLPNKSCHPPMHNRYN
ncbi:hypothetical protein J6590_095553 [Homalodisca vitripennis]|nr:hypothetical protein J6590_095553 [Homalodisca vitripennis]